MAVNVDNKKCFLSIKSAYYNDFCETEDWSNGCWKFSFALNRNQLHFKYIKIENGYFKL